MLSNGTNFVHQLGYWKCQKVHSILKKEFCDPKYLSLGLPPVPKYSCMSFEVQWRLRCDGGPENFWGNVINKFDCLHAKQLQFLWNRCKEINRLLIVCASFWWIYRDQIFQAELRHSTKSWTKKLSLSCGLPT